MKHKKSLLAVILVAILLTFAVSGTIAYLVDKTGEVVNTFAPAQVDTEIVEVIENGAKTSITVSNPKNDMSIPAYVRVAVVGNWCDNEGKIVAPWTPDFAHNGKYWTEHSDGYYYYNQILNVGATTENLLADGATISSTDADKAGLHLVVTVMQQAIQAEGMGVTSAQAAFAKAAE